MKGAAVFDLDYTIIYSNSTYEFIKYFLKVKHRLLKLFYFYILYFLDQLGLDSIYGVNMRLRFIRLLKSESKEDLYLVSEQFVNNRLGYLLNEDVMIRLENHRANGYKIYIVSGSLDFLVRGVADLINVKNYAGTELLNRDGICMGGISKDGLYTKLNYVSKIASTVDKVYFYSDNQSDLDIHRKYKDTSLAIVYEDDDCKFWEGEGISTLKVSERPSTSNFYIPASYYIFSRYPLKELFYVHIPFFILTILNFSSNLSSDFFILVVSWLGYISLYEVGYLKNDCYSCLTESGGTSRANKNICKSYHRLAYTRLFYFLVSYSLLFFIYGLYKNLLLYLSLNILVFVIFSLHNSLGKKSRLYTYPLLKVSHLVIPLSALIFPLNLILIPILFFYLPFEFIYYYKKISGSPIKTKNSRLIYISFPRLITVTIVSLISLKSSISLYLILSGIVLSSRDILSATKYFGLLIYYRLKNSIFYIKYFSDPESTIRYSNAINLIKDYLPKSGCKILDVGGGSRSIYPEIKSICNAPCVYSYDKYFSDYPNIKDLKKLKVSRKNELILNKNMFDFVCCLDTLEHISPKDRKKFIKTFFAYNSNYYLIAFPSGSSARLQDQELFNISSRSQDGLHNYLKEHLEYGLPSETFIEENLPIGYTIESKVWSMNTRFRGYFMKIWLKNRFLFILFSPIIILLGNILKSHKPCYRVYYLIKKGLT